MGKKTDDYAYSIHSVMLTRNDSLRVTGNIAIFALVYTLAGAVLSYILWYSFDPYDPWAEDDPDHKKLKAWENKGILFNLYDISVELIIIAISAFWLTYYLDTAAPIIPIRKGLEDFVDSYTSGMFFMFAVFVFLDDISYKMKYVFNYMFGGFFDYWVPEEGSLLDMTVKYSNRQRELHKKAAGGEQQRKISAPMFHK
jgi:hypothetical protein